MFIVTPIFGSTNLYIFIILEHVPICIRVLLGLHIFIIVTPIFLACAYLYQGTTRPTHYHILHDEIGFTPDDLQELVHSLSYV
jgi:hypothetical protein